MFRLLFAVIITCCVSVLYTWDISDPRNRNNDVLLRHVSLYYLRAFLCVESMNKSITIPTLLESTWPENILAIRPRIFPNAMLHVTRDTSDCKRIHQSRSSDVDGNGYLWVLDVGSEFCPAKIIIFDLESRNKEILRSNVPKNHGQKLTSIKVNPYTVGTVDQMAYLTLADGQHLIAFFFYTKQWREIPVSCGDDWPDDQVHPTDIAFTLDKRLYIVDQIGNLYVTNSMSTANDTEVKVNRLGMLLDQPRGLITDEKGYVYYIIPRFGAIVRWNPIRTLNAEGHDVLKFHNETIIQILFGVRGSVWVALERMSAMRDHCLRLMYHFSNNAIL